MYTQKIKVISNFAAWSTPVAKQSILFFCQVPLEGSPFFCHFYLQ
jgi:hypothetical protein